MVLFRLADRQANLSLCLIASGIKFSHGEHCITCILNNIFFVILKHLQGTLAGVENHGLALSFQQLLWDLAKNHI